ncbi:MAG: heavy-metal-associated domain-containing protein [Haloferacaceae archaeon]
MKRETLAVTGLSCDGCERNVESALQNVDGVARVDADHEADVVEIVAEDGVADDDLRVAIERAGYDGSV